MVAALQLMQRHIGTPAAAVMCAEIGGIIALLPLVLGAICDAPSSMARHGLTRFLSCR